MALDHPMWADRLCYGSNSMVLYVARLNVLGIACDERHVFTLFVLQADLPSSKQLWSWLYVLKPGILKRSLEFATDNILQAVVRDDMVVCALVLDRDSFLHQPTFLKLVAIDEGTTETALLIWGETLSEVRIHPASRFILAWKGPLKRGGFVLIIGVVDVVAVLGDCWPSTLLTFALRATRRVQSSLFLFRL